MTPIKLGDFVRTGLEEVGTVVGFLTIPGLVVLKDWNGDTFHAVEEFCEVIGGGGE